MTTTFDRPGVFITETLANPQVSNDVNLSNAVFVGPMLRGPGARKQIAAYSDFQRQYGGFVPGVTPTPMEYAVWQYFNNGGRNAHIVRALVGDEAAASVNLSDRETTGQTNEVQTVTVTGTPTGGTFTLSFSGQTTSAITYNAAASAVRTALAGLSTVGAGNVAVAGSAGGPYTVTFQGALQGTDVAAMTADGSALTGGTTPGVTVATTTPGVAPTTNTSLVVKAQNPGVWGNDVYVAVTDSKIFGQTDPATRFNITVYYKGVGQANIVERHSDLSLDPADPRYALGIINDPENGSVYITIALPDPLPSYSTSNAANLIPKATVTAGGAVQPLALAGGANTTTGANVSTYLDALAFVDEIAHPVGINMPGVTDAPTINGLLAYCAGRGDAFSVVDGIAGAAATATDQVTLSSEYAVEGSRTSYGAAYFPRVVFADPASNAPSARVTLPIGGAVLGRYAVTDATEGVFGTAAGDTARIVGAVGLATALTAADLALLNKNGINAVRNKPGAGVVLYGGRTLKGGSKADRYISVRRSLIYIKAQIEQRIQPFVFEPNRPITWQQMQNVVNQFLLDFWNAGGLEGSTPDQAYFCVCDDSNNTNTTIAAGEVHMSVGVATVTPAEFIAIDIAQFDGSVTVTDSAA